MVGRHRLFNSQIPLDKNHVRDKTGRFDPLYIFATSSQIKSQIELNLSYSVMFDAKHCNTSCCSDYGGCLVF